MYEAGAAAWALDLLYPAIWDSALLPAKFQRHLLEIGSPQPFPAKNVCESCRLCERLSVAVKPAHVNPILLIDAPFTHNIIMAVTSVSQ